MKIIDRLPWDIIGPLVFLLVAFFLLFFTPVSHRWELILMISGAALTRVRKSPPPVAPKPVTEQPTASPTVKPG